MIVTRIVPRVRDLGGGFQVRRIEAAAEDWKAGRFPPVPGDPEFIPLPERPPRPVDYP